MSTHYLPPATPPASTGHGHAQTAAQVRARLPRGWPYRPAHELDDPESAYWIGRIEAAAQTTSPDLVLAAHREFERIGLHRGPTGRRVTAAVCGVVSASVAGVGIGTALMWAVTPVHLATGTGPWETALLVAMSVFVVLFTTARTGTTVYRTVLRHFAHTAVIARERLDRWLPPIATHPLYRAIAAPALSTTADTTTPATASAGQGEQSWG